MIGTAVVVVLAAALSAAAAGAVRGPGTND